MAEIGNAALLRESWLRVASHGDEAPLFFYSWLFLHFPHLRGMFGPTMASQRDRFVAALGQIVGGLEELPALTPFLAQLGRDHRKFGVSTAHYPPVGQALLATLAHFLADDWTEELAAGWRSAYDTAASIMTTAAETAASTTPPWWEAEIVAHERRTPEIAVITVRAEPRLDYLPGQSIAVHTSHVPRRWRYYSPANAPREDGSVDLHVRAVDGGWVSTALVHTAGVGDVLRLGAPVGHELTLAPESTRDLLLLAGGTGLAPLRALVDQLAAGDGDRAVHLYVGARAAADLYDLPSLYRATALQPWLTVIPVVADEVVAGTEHGQVTEVACSHRPWEAHEVYVCGSADMVAHSRRTLARHGVPASRVHHETFTDSAYAGVIEANDPAQETDLTGEQL